jgi:hypothetical protein
MKARKTSARADIKIRLPEPLRADIERAARERGGSMNAEMVERLSRSFEMDAAYGPRTAALLRLLGQIPQMLGGESDQWLSGDYTEFHKISDQWIRQIRRVAPPMPDEVKERAEFIRRRIKALERQRNEASRALVASQAEMMISSWVFDPATRSELEELLKKEKTRLLKGGAE